MSNPLKQLEAFGQSVWLDYIQRSHLLNGGLQKMIDDDGLSGMTSNPAIFEQAISKSNDYDQTIEQLLKEHKDIDFIYEALTQEDVRTAADIFRPVYNRKMGNDGYVSLEVNPHLAHDTKGTLEEARRLWKALNRPNVFIKVPGTKEGVPAIKQLISEGININVTLLFGLKRYKEVAQAYIEGLKMRVERGEAIDHIACVASFFLSRIDTMIDPLVGNNEVKGQVAIASAKLAYEIYKDLFHGENFETLRKKGGRTQRLLWASTSTKNPEYSDVKYVEALIGPDTVNTMPMETLKAYRDHGKPEDQLENDTDHAKKIFQELPSLNINIEKITQKLEDEGVEKFNTAFDQLMNALKAKSNKKGV